MVFHKITIDVWLRHRCLQYFLFNICEGGSDIPSFISDIGNLCLFSFFFVSLAIRSDQINRSVVSDSL